jgi:hypothetical protein
MSISSTDSGRGASNPPFNLHGAAVILDTGTGCLPKDVFLLDSVDVLTH